MQRLEVTCAVASIYIYIYMSLDAKGLMTPPEVYKTCIVERKPECEYHNRKY